MGTVRYFSGTRDKGESASASHIMRDQIRKGGKVTPELYKKMVQEKLKQAKLKASTREHNYSMYGKMLQKASRSKSAQKTLKLVAALELQKEIKKMRKEVVIEVRRYINGKIDAKGHIRDNMGNIVAKVNLKNGAITTMWGQYIGIYKPKSFLVKTKIEETINKNSPFLINQRAALLKQQQQQNTAPTLNVWSNTATDIWGRPIGTDGWGRPQTDAWGRTQTDAWGNAQVDMWGNQI